MGMTRKRGMAEADLGDLLAQVAENMDVLSSTANPVRAAPSVDAAAGHRERMREKLLTAGPDALLDYEMLEMVLFLALPRQDTKPIAKALLARFGSFAASIAAPANELAQVSGMGSAGIAALKTVQAAAIRLLRGELKDRDAIGTWDQLMGYLNATLAREPTEQFRVLYLNNRNHLIEDKLLGIGTVNHTPVYPREVVKRAMDLHATAMILVHNHPSGDPTPSRADIDMTREVRAAATALGIVLHDHVVIGNGAWVSMRKEGLL
jgi:DNA repair protein RadC